MPEKIPTDRDLLHSWQLSTPLPRNFKAGVWNRLASAPRESIWHQALAWLDEQFRRPAPALAYIATLLAVGLVAGYWQGRERASEHADARFHQYLQLVDPYQAVNR